MNIEATSIDGVMVASGQAFSDHRGAFQRLYCDKELAGVLGSRRVVQVNHSRTVLTGAVRGMHYQFPPHAEMKLVRCLRGRVWDVAVDLREGSPTFLHWHAVELSPQNGRLLVIPEGCAHGFQTLEPESELLYLHTSHYVPQAEGGLRHDDPRLGIDWPLPVADLSQRDRSHPLLTSEFSGIKL
ncbi:dTDP-4-dehydrorhamnose 3,5-epimerase [Cupriavidus consociatus]|uniref:dTDP-4-dehydrorhamnose 3,5-epimerase n=1 Tax=Cupriavidus consociatus TaxID=2821357 RepID=UPI001AE8BAB9|nr:MULTISPECIES: dTDP-4-dehydrorhamnose 3,5-epimerase [unclassified Cupriavidus]MBP0621443.1 dTDP-4-dehydrorhamnose 3,5-epimerase [Cupriavidus sp. LEh25]MDK2658116.1 dTDP-4-dehydrorhamnose 3,5-epimerase [Cupriavidus sp. LEh21]